MLTAHVGVVDDRFAPRATAVVLVGADGELVRRVGFQVVDDCVAGWTGLIDPLPVPLPVADSVEPAGRKSELSWWTYLENKMSIFHLKFLRVLCLVHVFSSHYNM